MKSSFKNWMFLPLSMFSVTLWAQGEVPAGIGAPVGEEIPMAVETPASVETPVPGAETPVPGAETPVPGAETSVPAVKSAPAAGPLPAVSPAKVVTETPPPNGNDVIDLGGGDEPFLGKNGGLEETMMQEEVTVTDEDPSKRIKDEELADERAREEFEKLWESSIQNEMGEADISNDVDVQDIVEPSTEYRYASFGKRDPFVPPFGKFEFFSPSTGKSKYELPVVNNLQRPLDQLTLTGIWLNGNEEFRALIAVREPTGIEEGVIAKVGDPFGPAGKITEINEYKLVTRQYRIEQDGTRTFEDRSLYLGDPSEILNQNAKRTVMLGPGGRTVFRIESDLAGSEGVTRYVDAQTGQDVTAQFLNDQEEELRERLGQGRNQRRRTSRR